MPSYISPDHLMTDAPKAAQEIAHIAFYRDGEEWLCSLYSPETYIASGRGACMEFALTSALNARNDDLSAAQKEN